MKRTLLLLLPFLLLLGCEPDAPAKKNILELLPVNTVYLAEINDWNELQSKRESAKVLKLMRPLSIIADFERHLSNVADFLPQDSLDEAINDSEIFLAQVLSGADRYDWLLFLFNDAPSSKSLFEELLRADGMERLNYAGEEIFHIRLNAEQELFCYQQDDIYILSGNKLALEAVLRQKTTATTVPEMQSLGPMRQSRNPRAVANIYFKLNATGDYFKTLSSQSFSFLKGIGDWIALDLDAEGNDLFATGLISHPETQAYYPQSLANLRNEPASAKKLIPINIAQWNHLSLGNIGQYHRAYLAYLEKDGRLNDYQDLLAKLPAQASSKLNGIIDSEMGTFAAGRGTNSEAYQFAYFNFRDLDLCEETMASLADSNFIEGYRGHVIRKLGPMNLLPRLYGRLFEDFHHPYYLIHEDFVLLGNQLPALKVVLNDILDKKTLDRSDSYLNLSTQLAGRAHMQIVIGMPEWISNHKDQFNKELSLDVENHMDSLQNLRWGILQLRAEKDRSFVSMMLREERSIQEKIVRQWSVQLEGQPKGEPQFLRNHMNQKLDIAIQDENNQLYLISRKGEVYWTQKLDGPILGEIKQIDIFKNNKLQMVFNTPNKLWVLDRLGRNVEGFPVDLPAASTAPVGVFNYDQARNYRLVVPCGPDLVNYTVEGKIVEGWNFKTAASNIVSEPQFFSVGGKDIIVCLSADGKLYQLNRRGEERFKVEESIEELKTSFYLKAGEDLASSELIAGSNSGKMYVINPEGKVDALFLDQSHPADHLIYFEGRYIFSDDQDLFVKDDQRPFKGSFEDDISVKPKAMILNNRFYAAAFSAEAEEIRLFNEEGDLVDGFPVFAQGPFDMGSLNRDKSLNIVTYSSDGTLICYRLR